MSFFQALEQLRAQAQLASDQELFAIDPSSPASQLQVHDTSNADDTNYVIEMPEEHEHHKEELMSLSPIEVTEPVDVEIVVEELPGAPAGTPDPELEVKEEPMVVEEKTDENDVKKPGDKWDWSAANDSNGFVEWIRSRLADVPKHSGSDSAGVERACAYMEKLDNEISKAMRVDLDGKLDANKVEKIRAELDDGLSRLHTRLEKIRSSKKSSKKRKKSAEYIVDEEGFVKEAQKITGVQGVYVMVPLLISSIGRSITNGVVSAGYDLERLAQDQIEKWKLTDREQLELRQYLFDSGMAIRMDMGVKPDEDVKPSDSQGHVNWMTNYYS